MLNNRNILLYPFSLFYGIGSGIRNFMFNTGLLSSEEFDVPVICVGNITVGGTGKTPHTEYIAGLLSQKYNVAVLSRGYKRTSRGFMFVNPDSSPAEAGDEPLMLRQKLPAVAVAVDRKRVNGIKRILEEKPEKDVIILDDGFQHRKVKPGFSVLLSDYSRPMMKDHLIPYGSLRETFHNMKRADVIIITKTPQELSPIDRRLISSDISKLPWQNLYFTSVSYGSLLPVFGTEEDPGLKWNSYPDNGAVLVTGIANPGPLHKHLERVFSEIRHLEFSDHHDYDEGDTVTFASAFNELKSANKYIITTEKDAVKIRTLSNIPDELSRRFFFMPVSVKFLNGEKEDFDKQILNYVGKNKRNSRISKEQRHY